MLRRIIYTSASLDGLNEDIITDILEAAARNNSANDVSGLLIAGGGCFFQVLEGKPDEVARTFERIRGDSRHCAPLVLWDQPVDTRLFPRWAMRWHKLEDTDPLAARLHNTHVQAFENQALIPENDPANILLSVFLDSLGN